EQEIIREKKLLDKFFETLGERPERVVYDEKGIRKAIQYGAVEILILSKKLDKNLSKELKKLGCKVFYPGLPNHNGYHLMNELMNEGFGYGGMLAVDAGDIETADRFMAKMQDEKVGYLAVSLGYFKTLFSSPGQSTSSEIPEEEQRAMGLSEGLVRISIGLDNDMAETFKRIKKCLNEVGLCK
ncbi:MAG: PLP-dependent transferase, partial [Bacteroidetes bacterium]|nr:PLP-dependent transferase [Bacteroidota bacterium]